MNEQVEHGMRIRSPGYPAISLKEAVEKAAILNKKTHGHYSPMIAISQHWGFAPTSTKSMVILATLKKYGLVEYDGTGNSRKARITELAEKIILDEREDSFDKKQAIKEAALKPKMIKELWQEYDGQIPSDADIEYKLRFEKKFSERAVKQFIKVFRQTIDYSELSGSDILSGYEDDKIPLEEEEEIMPGTSTILPPKEQFEQNQLTKKRIDIPMLKTGEWATVYIQGALNTETLDRVIRYLQFIKDDYKASDKPDDKKGEG